MMTKRFIQLLLCVFFLGLSANVSALGSYTHFASMNAAEDPVRGICNSFWEDQVVYKWVYDCVILRGLSPNGTNVGEKSGTKILNNDDSGEEIVVATSDRIEGCNYCVYNNSEFRDNWNIGYLGQSVGAVDCDWAETSGGGHTP